MIQVYNTSFVFCCKFWNDLAGLKRLVHSLGGYPCIFVDGRWKNYGVGQPLSTDGSREFLVSCGYDILDAPDMMEWESRNTYIEEAQKRGFEYCIVIDSDEWVMSVGDLNLGKYDSYRHKQHYPTHWHPIYYRIHRTTARHRGKHQQCWIGDRQIFSEDSPIVPLETGHDKTLRNPEEEKRKKKYYKANPVR